MHGFFLLKRQYQIQKTIIFQSPKKWSKFVDELLNLAKNMTLRELSYIGLIFHFN